jgi:hypothetical protein
MKKGGRGTYDSGVCDSHNEAVFRGCVTVLGLSDETLASVVISFAFPTLHRSAECSVSLSPEVERV